MPAKLSVHIPGEAVIVRVLADDADIAIGRDPACGIVIAHDSVSRRHANLRLSGTQTWTLTDLGSKNGLRVDGHRVACAELSAAQWLAVGDVFCEFEPIDAAMIEHLDARATHRRETSRAWLDRAHRAESTDSFVTTLLAGIVDIAECKRGFLLVTGAKGELLVRACLGIDKAEVGSAAFSGSRSAVERAVLQRRPVFLSDRRDQAWLRDQASVIASGIRALACLPLQQDGQLIGVAYADTDDEAKVFSELDAELLAAFAERTSTTLAALELDDTLLSMEFAAASTRHAALEAAPSARESN
jgi:GAF domain-containing protein